MLVNTNLVTKQTLCGTFFIMKSGGERALCHSGKNMYVFIRQLEKVGGKKNPKTNPQ